ncbi:MAG: hypothetical protein M0T74_03580 [Desulfitobacterium hafniense]|nr:hypothetical protein [Desulfitobacterium hafniense]
MQFDWYQITWFVLISVILVVVWRRQRKFIVVIAKREQAIGKLFSFFLDLEEKDQDEFYNSIPEHQARAIRSYISWLMKGRPVVVTKISPDVMAVISRLYQWLEDMEMKGRYIGFLDKEQKNSLRELS